MLDHKALLEEHSDKAKGFTYPHWGEIAEIVDESCAKEERNTCYVELAREWMLFIKDDLAGDFELNETANFFILSNENAHTTKNLAYHCERSLKLILDEFGGTLEDSGYGKHILMVFNTVEQYNLYVSYFSGDGATPASGGMCIYNGYTHIVLPTILDDRSPIGEITHELSHALVVEYELPNWIDEAIAMRMQDIAVEYDGLALTKESYKKHQHYWNEKTIQEFWSGEVWSVASDAFELSYELARILWKKIAGDLHATKEEIVEFIKTLNYNDSGNAAFKAIFNHSLGDLVEDFLGEGDWEPDEEYLTDRSQAYKDAPAWIEDVKPLEGLSGEELLLCSVSRINPSPMLSDLFGKLNSVTLGDLVNTPTDRVFENRNEIKECSNELQVKLGILELTMKYEEVLLDISHLFSIFQDGVIVSGYNDIGRCTLMIEVRYLAEMIDPSFKQFKVEIENFDGYDFDALQMLDEQGNKPAPLTLTFDQVVNLNLAITGAIVSIGKVAISTLNEDSDPPGGDFMFYGSSAKIYDETGKEWSLDQLDSLAEEYWQGC